jgi:hypothetical protein
VWTALIPFPTAVVAEHLADGGEAARTSSALYSGVLPMTSFAFAGLFAWITHDDRLLDRLPPPRGGAGGPRALDDRLVVYAVAFAVSWVSAPPTLVLCGLMALYYAFDQASVLAAV